MKGKLRLFAAHGKLALFFLFNYAVTLLRNVYWWLTGRLAEIKEAQANYATSGHKMGFYYKYTIDPIFVISRLNFGLYHEGFVHPEYVLRDDVTLLQITDTEAIFVEAKKGMEPAYSSTYSFFFNGQYLTANKIICMPLKSFFRLADEMQRHDAKIVLIYNQSRCGSTLLTSIFEHTGRCLAFAEPQALNLACKRVVDGRLGISLLRATVWVICKPNRSLPDKVLAYVIKPTTLSIAAAGAIQEAMPQSIPVFLYRDPIAIGQSMRRLAEVAISVKMLYFLMELKIPNVCYYAVRFIGQVADGFWGFTPQSATGIECGYFAALLALYERERARKRGVDIPAIRFDDLTAHPQEILTKLMQHCGLPEFLVAPGLEAMKRDSQHATPFNQIAVRKAMPMPPQPTPQMIEEMRVHAKKFGLPEHEQWTDSLRLDNSILPSNSASNRIV